MRPSPQRPILAFPAETSRDDLPIAEIVRRYLEQLRCRAALGSCSPDHCDNQQRDLHNFAALYGARPVSQAQKTDALSWLAENPAWVSNHTRKRAISSLLACFNWAVEEGLVARNPYAKLKLDLPTEPRRPMEASEYVALMRKASRPLRRALFFLRRTGARTKEMRDLTWDQIDWQAGVIILQKHKTRKKSGQPRLIGLDAAVLRFLRNLHRQAGCPGEGTVFTNCDGLPWKTRQVFDRHFRRWADRLGLARDVTPYCARHAWTVAGIEAGLSDRALADQLGHSGTQLVGWYGRQTRLRCQHLRNVASEVNRRRPRG